MIHRTCHAHPWNIPRYLKGTHSQRNIDIDETQHFKKNVNIQASHQETKTLQSERSKQASFNIYY